MSSIPLPLPPAPESITGPVRAWSEALPLPCPTPPPAERHPVFAHYPYPVPVPTPKPLPSRQWQAFHLENEWLRFLIVPEAGAALYLALDNRQEGAFLPVPERLSWDPHAAIVESAADGARTVWCSAADAKTRVRVSRGFTLYPGRAYLEIKVRLFNQSPLPQPFIASTLVPACPGTVHLAPDRQEHGILYPFETKVWSEFCYPAPGTNPTLASVDGAAQLSIDGQAADLTVIATSAFPGATLSLEWHGMPVWSAAADLSPAAPYRAALVLPAPLDADAVTLRIKTSRGRELRLLPIHPVSPVSPIAALPPRKVPTLDLLHHTARQQTDPNLAESYWAEAIRREPSDLDANTALGLLYLRRGAFSDAESHLAGAAPRSPEAQYLLGVSLRFLGRDEEARAAFQGATHHYPWRAAALYALGELEVASGAWELAPKYLYEGLRLNADNNHQRSLAAVVFRRFGRAPQADALLNENLALDPLDGCSCYLAGKTVPGDNRIRLDIAYQCLRAGLVPEADQVLTGADIFANDGSAPMLHFTLQDLAAQDLTPHDESPDHGHTIPAADAAPIPFQHSRPYQPEELLILQRAVLRTPSDADAFYHLGNWLAGHSRIAQARECWTISLQLRPSWAPALRNLDRLDEAFVADPADAQLFWERDCQWKANRVPAAARLAEFERHPELVAQRDDLTREMAALFNLLNQPERTLAILQQAVASPQAHPETLLRAELKLARRLLDAGDAEAALASLRLLAAQYPDRPDLHFWLGETYRALQRPSDATSAWYQAFQAGSPDLNDQTYFRALAASRLGHAREVRTLLRQLWFHGRRVAREKAPGRKSEGLFLQSQARVAMGQWKLARRALDQLLATNPNHEPALELLAELPK